MNSSKYACYQDPNICFSLDFIAKRNESEVLKNGLKFELRVNIARLNSTKTRINWFNSAQFVTR